MTKTIKFGSASGTQLHLHYSWLWIAPLIIYTLVTLNLEPLPEAIITMLLIFASVLITTLVRIVFAQKNGLGWQSVTLFLLGATVKRTYLSNSRQSVQIESAGMMVSTLLAVIFGVLWFMLPTGPLGIEMEIVALFNAALVARSLLTRLSPAHDNLLHALLTKNLPAHWPSTIMTMLHSLVLIIFAASSVFMLGLGWLAFGWWFALAVMLSQIVDSAESLDEYRTDWLFAPHAEPVEAVANSSVERII